MGVDVGDTTIADGTSVEFSSLGVTIGASGTDVAFGTFTGTADKVDVQAGRTLQVGADNSVTQKISFGLQDLASNGALAIDTADLSSLANSQTAIDTLDTAINTINDARSNV